MTIRKLSETQMEIDGEPAMMDLPGLSRSLLDPNRQQEEGGLDPTGGSFGNAVVIDTYTRKDLIADGMALEISAQANGHRIDRWGLWLLASWSF